MNLKGRERKYSLTIFMQYLCMQHVVSVENKTKYSHYSRSVARKRNIVPATIQTYQIGFTISVKSPSKSCSVCKLLYNVSVVNEK